MLAGSRVMVHAAYCFAMSTSSDHGDQDTWAKFSAMPDECYVANDRCSSMLINFCVSLAISGVYPCSLLNDLLTRLMVV